MIRAADGPTGLRSALRWVARHGVLIVNRHDASRQGLVPTFAGERRVPQVPPDGYESENLGYLSRLAARGTSVPSTVNSLAATYAASGHV